MIDKDTWYSVWILLTFLLGVGNLIYNYYNNKKTTFINTVTNQRIKWIELLRKEIGLFLGYTHTWCMTPIDDTAKKVEILSELDQLKYLIQLRLNPDGKNDREIVNLIEKITKLTHDSKIDERQKIMEELIIVSQKLLKEEWEKVKHESINGNLKHNLFSHHS
ncbi:hypothetical protein [Picosynechococcus sp. PCC 7117]|uniref:hypothetical protein n=1 Tax=Picosynechococcus sp. PCC 7117 TaxID=195498 RepID=UPI0008106ADD|nr:hypothetical protein [Picosynechococcus sp. PCC 7117]ANV88945.1 hypothetical protein AWQ22_15170 [Picosynechococcus sp. PCC 7117]